MIDPIEPVNSNNPINESPTIAQWLESLGYNSQQINTFLQNTSYQFTNVVMQQANNSAERIKEYFESALDDPEAPTYT